MKLNFISWNGFVKKYISEVCIQPPHGNPFKRFVLVVTRWHNVEHIP